MTFSSISDTGDSGKKRLHVPVVCYADFESILKPCFEGNKTHEHIPCGFCFHLVSPFVEMDPVLKRAENETNQLPQDFIRELISRVKQAHLSLPKKGNDSPEFGRMEKVSREWSLLALQEKIRRENIVKGSRSLSLHGKNSGEQRINLATSSFSGQNSPRCFSITCRITTLIFSCELWGWWMKFWA